VLVTRSVAVPTGSKLRDALAYLGRPSFLRGFHGWATIIWFLASFPLAILFGSSVVFVTFLSLYAIVAGHWSSWQAARVEVRQEDAETDSGNFELMGSV
jgi:hypothetical protein